MSINELKSLKKVIFYLLFIHILFTGSYLVLGLKQIDQERIELEEEKNLNLDVSYYDLAKLILVGSSTIILIIVSFGIFGIFFDNFCVILFFSTTGVGIFILLIITLLLENILSLPLAATMIILSLTTSSLTLYYGFEVNHIKKYKYCYHEPIGMQEVNDF